MTMVQSEREFHPGVMPQADLRFLRIMLGAQIALGLLWGVSMLFFARQIVLGPPMAPHREDRHGGCRPHDAGLRGVSRVACSRSGPGTCCC